MKAHPTYHDLGDHSETIEIDYDPAVLNYGDLVTEMLAAHDATRPHYAMQYRSAIFWRTEEEREIALAAIAHASGLLGRIRTAVERFDTFWLAEDYHQKYRLRASREIAGEFQRLCPTEREFVDSTAVARVNGWLSGDGDTMQLERELPLTGLSERAQARVRAVHASAGRLR